MDCRVMPGNDEEAPQGGQSQRVARMRARCVPTIFSPKPGSPDHGGHGAKWAFAYPKNAATIAPQKFNLSPLDILSY
jgi:hypothetical protein